LILRYSDPMAYREARRQERDSDDGRQSARVRMLTNQLKEARKRGDAVTTERIIQSLRDLGITGVRGRERLRANYVSRA